MRSRRRTARFCSGTRSSFASTLPPSSTSNGGWWDGRARCSEGDGCSSRIGCSPCSRRWDSSWSVDRWLRRFGLGEAHRRWALLLIATGGGLGGLLFELTGRGLEHCLDIYAGLFPFLALLTNPHFIAGTALLLLGLLLFDTAATRRDRARRGRGGNGAGARAALRLRAARARPHRLRPRPRASATLGRDPPAPRRSRAPSCSISTGSSTGTPAFAFYAGTPYGFPPVADFAWALGPATVLALLAFFRTAPDAAERARVHFAVWAALGLLVVLVRPVPSRSSSWRASACRCWPSAPSGWAGAHPARRSLVALLFSTSQVGPPALRHRARPALVRPQGGHGVRPRAALRPAGPATCSSLLRPSESSPTG